MEFLNSVASYGYKMRLRLRLHGDATNCTIGDYFDRTQKEVVRHDVVVVVVLSMFQG